MRIAVYQTERYLADKSAISGPVPDYVKGWSFVPTQPGGIVNKQGLVVAQDLDPGVSLTIEAPDGSSVAETASGTLALFLPGHGTGMDASEALALARGGRCGLSLA